MRNDLSVYRSHIKKQGYFSTQARLQLFKAFRAREAMTVPQILRLIPRQNAASGYRNIKLFEEIGIISRVKFGNLARYELSEMFRDHHHHLFCISCGKTIQLPENDALEKAIAPLGNMNNFHASYHQLEIMGICNYCHVNKIASKIKRPGVA